MDGLLHPREQVKFATLKTEKRRQDWLLGRWTAKQLIAEVVALKMGERPLLNTIEVRNRAMGDPIVHGNPQSPIPNPPILRQAQDSVAALPLHQPLPQPRLLCSSGETRMAVRGGYGAHRQPFT
ncbi:MAG: hypothetical protein M5U34_12595 [Chloroflexi bacterium]|nr:hypothetical protein [Chloroflexota bacterium]